MTVSSSTTGGSTSAARKPSPRVRPDGPDVRRHDFAGRPTLSPDTLDLLKAGGEAFATVWSDVLSAVLRQPCTAEVSGMDHVRLSDVIGTLGAPVALTEIMVAPMTLPVTVAMPVAAALSCVDALLGGTTVTEQPVRPLSAIDLSLLSRLVLGAFAELPGCFPGLALSGAYLGQVTETSADEPSALPVEDVVAVQMDLDLGGARSRAAFCLPGISVAKQLHGSGPSPAAAVAGTNYRDLLARALVPMSIDVAVQFRPSALTPAQLVTLAVGDVLRLNHPVSTPLAISAAGTVVARAVPGAEGRQLAVLVVAPPNQEHPAW